MTDAQRRNQQYAALAVSHNALSTSDDSDPARNWRRLYAANLKHQLERAVEGDADAAELVVRYAKLIKET